ncbi:MAG: ATP-binding protein, partial [Lentilitoribacter sp.]
LLRKPGSLVDVIYNFVVNAANPFRHSDKKKREKLLNEVLEGMDQAVVACSAGNIHERKKIMTNSKLQEMMELPDEMVQHGLNHDEMLSFLEKRGDLSDLDLLKLEKFRSQPDFSEHMSLTYKLPSGRYAQSLGSKREDGTGRIVTFNDITDIVNSERERAALAENLAHMQRLKSVGQLTGGVAHDFNNLLAVISGNAELLRMEMDADNSYISEILQSVKRGAELTQRLLAFSRKQTLRPKPLDTSEMIGGLSTMLKRTLGDDVIVSVDEASNLWTCYADRSQIENAILNLAVNSRDAMPNGGSLRIHVSNKELFSDFCNRFPELVPGKYVKVTIEDNGVGIPEELLTKVYDPFFTTKDIGKGSGLGLSMVYGFIKQSNGHISITSSENSGTTVTLYLPTTQEPVRTEAPSLHLIRTSRNGQTIVVVEDNLSV